MEIEELRTFVEVADAGGVSAAARRLGIAKAIVSRRLIRLEADLGVQLLARTTRGASLTEAGATFREYAAKMVADLDTARETISPHGALRGRLRIAAPLSFGPTNFAPVIAQLARDHPALHVHAYYSDRFVNLVEDGYDCAIRVGRLPPSTLLSKRVGPIYATLVASPDYIAAHGSPETPEELLGHEAILQGTESWYFTENGKTFTLNPKGRIKADNGVAITSAVIAGLGIAMLPDALIGEHLASGALVPVMTRYPPPELGIFVVRPPGQHPSRKVRALTDLLIACFEHTPRLSEPSKP